MTIKLRIWWITAKKTALSFDAGDSIGDRRLIYALSQTCDVYYNGMLVDPESDLYGGGEHVIVPDSGYDLYIVRANPEVFLRLPHPRMYMAYPYDEEVFSSADALLVTTSVWRQMLLDPDTRTLHSEAFQKWYPPEAQFTCPVVQFKQICDPRFSQASVAPKHWRYQMTNHYCLGFFGRLDVDALPETVIRALRSKLRSTPVLALAGKVRSGLASLGGVPRDSVYLGNVSYAQMPGLFRAVDYALAGEGADDLFLGSNKILDSISVGTPVICKRNAVREEYLGASYPGLFATAEEAAALIERGWFDAAFKADLLAATEEAALRNTPPHAGAVIFEELARAFPQLR